MGTLIEGVTGIATEPGRLVMMIIGGILMYLGMKREYEPTLLMPTGLDTVLVNFPDSGVLSVGGEAGLFQVLFRMGISTGLSPLLLFTGTGAMVDFGPLLQNPFLLLFGAAAQLRIFLTVIVAVLLGFDLNDTAPIGTIGAADGPASIFVASTLNSEYMGVVMVAAYPYMALVPVIQPVAIKVVTTRKERQIRMSYRVGEVSQTAKMLFPVVVSVITGLITPVSLPLVGFLMSGNLLRECDVSDRLFITAQSELVNIISILLGLSISVKMQYEEFLKVDTLIVIGLEPVAFIMDSVGGVLFAKLLSLFRKERVNPMIDVVGISTFPMSSRVIQKMATDGDPQNFILMHAVETNVSDWVVSVITGGLSLALLT